MYCKNLKRRDVVKETKLLRGFKIIYDFAMSVYKGVSVLKTYQENLTKQIDFLYSNIRIKNRKLIKDNIKRRNIKN